MSDICVAIFGVTFPIGGLPPNQSKWLMISMGLQIFKGLTFEAQRIDKNNFSPGHVFLFFQVLLGVISVIFFSLRTCCASGQTAPALSFAFELAVKLGRRANGAERLHAI